MRSEYDFEAKTPSSSERERAELVELWARLSAREGVNTQQTILEFAAALHTTPQEVEAMLEAAHFKSSHRDRLRYTKDFVRWLAIGVLAVVVMVGLFMAGYSYGFRHYRQINGSEDFQREPPAGFDVMIDNMTYPGQRNPFGFESRLELESRLASSIRTAAENSWSPVGVTSPRKSVDEKALKEAFRVNMPIPGVLSFKTVAVRVAGHVYEAKVPIPPRDNNEAAQLIEDELSRRADALAVQVMNAAPG